MGHDSCISHLVIPDAHVKPNVGIRHIEALANLIMERRPDVIVCLGDWWDFPSLGTHNDRGSIFYHNKSYEFDLAAGKTAMNRLLAPLRKHNKKMRKQKMKQYLPRMAFTCGNHEYRRNRLEDNSPLLKGALDTPEDYLFEQGWEVFGYKVPVVIDGVAYSHLAPQPFSAGAIGRAHLIANKYHCSWTVGHKQCLDMHVSDLKPRIQCLIAGAFYLHNEDYKQGTNEHWRGVVYKHDVFEGTYSPEFIEIDSLIRRYI